MQERDEPLEQYFDSMKELWGYDAFQTLLDELTTQVDSINSVENATSSNDLWFRKGQINVIRAMQNLRDNIEILETDYLQSLEPQTDEDEELYN